MAIVARFSGVSKRYRLGFSRTSVTSLARYWARRVLSTPSARSSDDKEYWALRDVSFELERSRSLALLGPNGAGKSTILKLLARITVPTSGRIEVNGTLAALIELGAGFHPDLTGRENVYLNGALLGLSRREIDARFEEIVAFAELERFIDTPIKRYSSGMTVRLGFAVSSCIEPDILLVDEVLAVGDAAFRQKCVRRIRTLLANGTSLMFVSHDMGLVKTVCDHAIYVENGLVQRTGPVSEVIDVYNEALNRRRASTLRETKLRTDAGSTDVEVTGVEILGRGRQVVELYGDQPLEIRVNYIAYRRVQGANVVVRVVRLDGVSCFVARTSVDRSSVDLETGHGALSVILDRAQLFGGTYYAVAWIMDADDSVGLCGATSDWFQVRNRVPGLDPEDGVFEPVRRWVHKPSCVPVALGVAPSPMADSKSRSH